MSDTIEDLLGSGGTVSPVASGTVTSGDLAALREDGKVQSVPSKAELDVVNQTSTGLSLVQGQVDALGANFGVGLEVGSRAVAELGNGAIAHAYTGNGTTQNSTVRCKIVDVAGTQVADVLVSATTGVPHVTAVKLNTTKFAVVWGTGTPSAQFAILNNDGSIAVNPTTVATVAYANPSKNSPEVNACAANGNLVIGYYASDYRLKMRLYDQAGAAVGNEITLRSTITNFFGLGFLQCANGDFVVHFATELAGEGFYASRWTNTGVQVGTTQALYTTGGLYPVRGFLEDAMAESANGNIAIACSGEGNDGYYDVKIINPGFTAVVATVDLGTSGAMESTSSSAWPAICAQDDGNFVIVLNGSQNLLAFRFSDTTGAITQQLTSISNAHTIASGGYPKRLFARYLPGIGLVILSQQANSTNQEIVLLKATKTFVLIGSVVALSASTTDYKRGLAAVLTATGILRYQFTFGAYASIKMGAYKVLRTSLLGVARATATDAAVKVATKGRYTLPAALTGQIFALNGRTNTVPGVGCISDGTDIHLMGA